MDQAIQSYIKGNNIKKALDVLISNYKWEEAIRLANDRSLESINTIYEKHGIELEERKEYLHAEEEYLKANRADLCIGMYLKNSLYDEAMRIAKLYSPIRIKEISLLKIKSEKTNKELSEIYEVIRNNEYRKIANMKKQ